MRQITLIPSYGRDYKNQRAVKLDFDSGKDFTIADLFSGSDGRQANKQDLSRDFDQVMIRYSRLTKIVIVKLGGKGKA